MQSRENCLKTIELLGLSSDNEPSLYRPVEKVFKNPELFAMACELYEKADILSSIEIEKLYTKYISMCKTHHDATNQCISALFLNCKNIDHVFAESFITMHGISFTASKADACVIAQVLTYPSTVDTIKNDKKIAEKIYETCQKIAPPRYANPGFYGKAHPLVLITLNDALCEKATAEIYQKVVYGQFSFLSQIRPLVGMDKEAGKAFVSKYIKGICDKFLSIIPPFDINENVAETFDVNQQKIILMALKNPYLDEETKKYLIENYSGDITHVVAYTPSDMVEQVFSSAFEACNASTDKMIVNDALLVIHTLLANDKLTSEQIKALYGVLEDIDADLTVIKAIERMIIKHLQPGTQSVVLDMMARARGDDVKQLEIMNALATVKDIPADFFKDILSYHTFTASKTASTDEKLFLTVAGQCGVLPEKYYTDMIKKISIMSQTKKGFREKGLLNEWLRSKYTPDNIKAMIREELLNFKFGCDAHVVFHSLASEFADKNDLPFSNIEMPYTTTLFELQVAPLYKALPDTIDEEQKKIIDTFYQKREKVVKNVEILIKSFSPTNSFEDSKVIAFADFVIERASEKIKELVPAKYPDPNHTLCQSYISILKEMKEAKKHCEAMMKGYRHYINTTIPQFKDGLDMLTFEDKLTKNAFFEIEDAEQVKNGIDFVKIFKLISVYGGMYLSLCEGAKKGMERPDIRHENKINIDANAESR